MLPVTNCHVSFQKPVAVAGSSLNRPIQTYEPAYSELSHSNITCVYMQNPY